MTHKNKSKKKEQKRQNLPSKPQACYVLSIPDDVLFEILIALGLPGSMDPQMSAKLTSICKRWRSFILNMPFFWTVVNNPFWIGLLYPNALNPFEGSKPALLDVIFDTKMARVTPAKLRTICDHVSKYSERFQRLTISVYGQWKDTVHIIFDKWKHRRMPHLQTLTVEMLVTMSLYNLPELPSLPLIANLHTLQSLKLQGVDINHCPQLPITHLDVTSIPPTFETFKHISTKFPRLETLVFRNVRPMFYSHFTPASNGSFDDIKDANAFSKLRSFAICLKAPIQIPPENSALPYLSKIMKSLEYIEIVSTHDQPLGATRWDVFLHQWAESSGIKKVKVHFFHTALWKDTKFFSSLPNGTILEIDAPPLGSQYALMEILNLKNLGAITIILAEKPLQPLPLHMPLHSYAFSQAICTMKPELCCPTTVRLPEKVYLKTSATKILGAYLTVERSWQQVSLHGLIDTTLFRLMAPNFIYSSEEDDDNDSGGRLSDYWSDHSYMGPNPFEIDSD